MLPHNYRYPKQNYTGSLAYAREQAAPNDVIASVGYLASGYRAYYGPDLAFPQTAQALRPGWPVTASAGTQVGCHRRLRAGGC